MPLTAGRPEAVRSRERQRQRRQLALEQRAIYFGVSRDGRGGCGEAPRENGERETQRLERGESLFPVRTAD
jgi:hypothetical protein